METSWLKYVNQGATRNDPITPSLISAMSFLPELGITMNVVSGGQEAAGEGGSRTGSTRHDHGNSADVDFYKGGRKLDWNNAEDLPLLQQVVGTAKSRGVTGIGAGNDYMGAGRFHIGFGAPSVWGAGGSSKNAPAWLTAAYNGAPSGAAPAGAPAGAMIPQRDQPVGQSAPTNAPAPTDYTRLAYAYANGKMSPEDEAIYERGMGEGVFPTASKKQQEQRPDPLAIYAATAGRQQQAAPMQMAQLAPAKNATPLQRYPGI